jgi:predicted homoserine dehydrogenase-like protein
MGASSSLRLGALPIGLAHGIRLKTDVAHGTIVRWSDVEIDAANETVKARRAMEAAFKNG